MPDVIVQTNVLYLVFAFFIFFVIREIVAFKRILTLKYVFTPLITYTVILIAIYMSWVHGFSRYNVFIIAGLLFALVADTLLMIEEKSYFLHGLLFFLCTHICYGIALFTEYTMHWGDIVIMVVVLGSALLYFRLIRNSVGKLLLPIVIYMAILSLVVFLSISILFFTMSTKGIILTLAALMFAISDGVVAYNQLVQKINHSTVLTWSLYAPAQLLFGLSCYY